MPTHPNFVGTRVMRRAGSTCGRDRLPHDRPCPAGHGWAKLVVEQPALLVLGGRLDRPAVDGLRADLRAVAADDGRVAVIDLNWVDELEDTALPGLLAALAAARWIHAGASLVLLRPSGSISGQLADAGVLDLVHVLSSRV